MDSLEEYTSDNTLVELYGRTQGLDSLDIQIEREKRALIIRLIREAKHLLTSREWQVLKLYCIDKLPYEAIGEIIDMSKAGVYKTIKRLPIKLASIPSDIYLSAYVALTDNPSTTEATTPKEQVGWLVTLLPRLEVSAEFREIIHKKKVKGKTKEWTEKKYETIVECRIPEYLQQSFRNREGRIPSCTLCQNKCKRKDDNNGKVS